MTLREAALDSDEVKDMSYWPDWFSSNKKRDFSYGYVEIVGISDLRLYIRCNDGHWANHVSLSEAKQLAAMLTSLGY